ncbi:MAG: hypothetical protein ACJ8LN_12720 [Sulfurifustis sp.]
MRWRQIGWIGLALLLLGCTTGKPAAAPEPAAAQSRVPGEYIITLRPDADPARITPIYRDLGLSRVQDLGHGKYLIHVSNDPGADTLLEIGDAAGVVEAVQPNFIYRTQ